MFCHLLLKWKILKILKINCATCYIHLRLRLMWKGSWWVSRMSNQKLTYFESFRLFNCLFVKKRSMLHFVNSIHPFKKKTCIKDISKKKVWWPFLPNMKTGLQKVPLTKKFKILIFLLYLWRYLTVYQSIVSDLHCGCNAAAKIPKRMRWKGWNHDK